VDAALREVVKGKNKSEQALLLGKHLPSEPWTKASKPLSWIVVVTFIPVRLKALAEGARKGGLEF